MSAAEHDVSWLGSFAAYVPGGQDTRQRLYVQFMEHTIGADLPRGCQRHVIVCNIFSRDVLVMQGVAVHQPTDEYDRGLGRRIALTRALRSLQRAHRRLVWKAYWAHEWTLT